jgi:hypothetical protein
MGSCLFSTCPSALWKKDGHLLPPNACLGPGPPGCKPQVIVAAWSSFTTFSFPLTVRHSRPIEHGFGTARPPPKRVGMCGLADMGHVAPTRTPTKKPLASCCGEVDVAEERLWAETDKQASHMSGCKRAGPLRSSRRYGVWYYSTVSPSTTSGTARKLAATARRT